MQPETVKGHFRDPRAVDHYGRAAARIGLWRSEEKIFGQIFRSEDSLLDIGCGAGRITIGLWKRGYHRIEGVDFAPEMVARAKEVAESFGAPIPFHRGDATALPFADGSFAGAIFGFNGLMQIPRRERRRQALTETRRVVQSGGHFVFTTHDRANRRYWAYWEEEAERWARGEQDPRLEEFGDRYYEAPIGATFMHIPTREEVIEDLAAVGWRHEADYLRRDIAREPAEVREFSDECRFWIVRKPALESEEAGD